MCVAYLVAGAFGGMLSGASMDVNVGSLLAAVLGNIIMSLGWAGLYTFLNVVLRRHFGISIALSFFIGTGISEVVYLSDQYETEPSTLASKRMLQAVGVRSAMLRRHVVRRTVVG